MCSQHSWGKLRRQAEIVRRNGPKRLLPTPFSHVAFAAGAAPFVGTRSPSVCRMCKPSAARRASAKTRSDSPFPEFLRAGSASCSRSRQGGRHACSPASRRRRGPRRGRPLVDPGPASSRRPRREVRSGDRLRWRDEARPRSRPGLDTSARRRAEADGSDRAPQGRPGGARGRGRHAGRAHDRGDQDQSRRSTRTCPPSTSASTPPTGASPSPAHVDSTDDLARAIRIVLERDDVREVVSTIQAGLAVAKKVNLVR